MANQDQNQTNQQVNIELGEKEAEGTYSNLAIITHSNAEFVIDFTRILPGVPKARVQSRIIMTPVHTKLLLNALHDNIEKYERKHGEIKISGDPQQMFTGTPPGGAVH
ncbi:MAG: hypothetical protein CL946_12625 [Ectothiorhodospiraceae bacterium]|nr:hypothetical protein [Ectothiorhodospiraceae bacterium]